MVDCRKAPVQLSEEAKSKPDGYDYSLPSPDLAMPRKTVPGDERKLEPFLDLGLDKDRCSFIAFVRVFLIYSSVMLLWIFAAL